MPTSASELRASLHGPSKRLADGLFQSLVNMIEKEFPPGSRLPSEAAIAERFGVSRPTLRETLAQMRVDGLISSRRGSGSYVSSSPPARMPPTFVAIDSLQQIKNCYEFRAAFECEAAAVAAQSRDAAQLDALRRTLSQLEEAIDDIVAGPELDFIFHLEIARATGNPWFADALSAMKPQIQTVINIGRQLSLTKPISHMQAVQNEHGAVFAAIETRDSAAARAAMREHISNGCGRIFNGQPNQI